MNNDTPDNTLVKLTLKDTEHFSLLMERYEPKLIRYIMRITNVSIQCAEDILQEVFLKIYKNLNSFDLDLKFSSWAYRIAHNETLNYVRKNKKHDAVSIETDDPELVNLIDILESDSDVEADAQKAELQHEVAKILGKLPAAYREVLVLRFLEDLDYNEISDVLKKPVGTVGTLLNRAKSKFKQLAVSNDLTL